MGNQIFKYVPVILCNYAVFSEEQISNSVTYPELIEALREAFQAGITVPDRHHHFYEHPEEGKNSVLLLMPAWKEGKDLGVKVVTVSPENDRYKLPAIQGGLLFIMKGEN